MYNKDFLQKQFEEFGKVMAALFGLRKQKELDAYEREFFSAFMTYTKLAPEVIEGLSLDEFKNEIQLQIQKNISQNQLQMLADLLYEKINFYLELENEKRWRELREKCLYLYEYLIQNASLNEFNLGTHYRVTFLNALEQSPN